MKTLIHTCMLFYLLHAPSVAIADSRYWVTDGSCDNGNWNDSSCWSETPGGPGGATLPQVGDDANLIQSDDTDRIVNYLSSSIPTPRLKRIRIDATVPGSMTLSQTQDSLETDLGYIGISGSGAYTQTGGSSWIGMSFVGNEPGSIGTINLSSIGTLHTGIEFIGYNGIGYVNQAGGTHQVNNYISLADQPDSSGFYNLSDGTVTAPSIQVGNYGVGEFNQSSGSVTLTGVSPCWLSVGDALGSHGVYNLSGASTLTVIGGDERIGSHGTGEFNQTGGTNTVGNNLTVGFGDTGKGTYNLISGTTTVANKIILGEYADSHGVFNLKDGTLSQSDYSAEELIGAAGTGIFNQSGGTNSAGYFIVVGQSSGSRGTYNLDAGTVSTIEMITGYFGDGEFNQDGGTVNVDRSLRIGDGAQSTGAYYLNSGDLYTEDEWIGIKGSGAFTQNGGFHKVNSTVRIGASGFGAYELAGGMLESGEETVGSLIGPAEFNQTGGTNLIHGELVLGTGCMNCSGAYKLETGSLEAVDETIGHIGEGIFMQTGGTNTVEDTLTIAQDADSIGTYSLSGGSLRASKIDADNAGANFDFSGGRLSVDSYVGDLFNNGGVLAPGASAGLTLISGDYTQATSGSLEIEIVGSVLGVGFDSLEVSGTAMLDGNLDIILDPVFGELVGVGDAFEILSATSITGSFATITGQTIGNGLFFDVNYNAENVVLMVAVPEPSTLVLIGLGLAGLRFGQRGEAGSSRPRSPRKPYPC